MGALNAVHLVSALRGTDAKLQSSALWATTRLPEAELAKLAPVLLGMKPAAAEVDPYLVRALGPLGTDQAFDRIGDIIRANGKEPFVRQAAVSGLVHHGSEFLAKVMKDSKDTELVGWLEQGNKATPGGTPKDPGLKGADLASFQRGKTLFHGEAACFGCHSADGAGMPNLGPPLDGSEWVVGKPETLARILLHGLTGPVKVGGESYNPAADMPGLGMNPNITDQTIADIATYVRNEWSNKASAVNASAVKQQREANQGRSGKAWTSEELLK